MFTGPITSVMCTGHVTSVTVYRSCNFCDCLQVHENDQAILCESGCNFWFHRTCVGLTEEAFRMLKTEVYAEWVCDRCFSSKNIPLVKYKP